MANITWAKVFACVDCTVFMSVVFWYAIFKFDYYLGDDVTAQAQSRATTTSAISVQQKIDTAKQMTQGVVSTPTRELVQQVSTTYILGTSVLNLHICLRIVFMMMS